MRAWRGKTKRRRLSRRNAWPGFGLNDGSPRGKCGGRGEKSARGRIFGWCGYSGSAFGVIAVPNQQHRGCGYLKQVHQVTYFRHTGTLEKKGGGEKNLKTRKRKERKGNMEISFHTKKCGKEKEPLPFPFPPSLQLPSFKQKSAQRARPQKVEPSRASKRLFRGVRGFCCLQAFLDRTGNGCVDAAGVVLQPLFFAFALQQI